MIDQSGLDTKLARLLHKQGKIGLDLLQTCLAEIRAQRSHSGTTLARVLVQRGILTEEQAVASLARAVAPGSSEERLASSLVDSAPTKPRATRPRTSSGSMTALAFAWRPGARIGDFEIKEQLGAGGMGIVYSAENIHSHALYALKTLPDRSDPDMVARLKREGETLASVGHHPNVVRVHSLGSAHGRIFLVIELVKGGDLAARMHGGPLPVAEAARIARDLARGLAFLHPKGILHRDLKPANVLFDEDGTPKLVDFGLALLASADRLTQTGEILGTPKFMAPEQAIMDRANIGPWTDVYGLGAVLYNMLTGQPPVEGTTLVEVMTRVVSDPIVAPRTRRPEVPAALEAICLRALAKEREARPTAEELANELDAFLSGRPAGGPGDARRTGRLGPARGPGGRSRRLLVVALAVLGALAVAALVVFAKRGPGPAAPPPPPPVVEPSGPAPPRDKTPRRRDPVAYRYEVGEVRSMTLTHAGVFPMGMGFMKVKFNHQLELRVEVSAASSGHTRLACTIERLVLSQGAAGRADGPREHMPAFSVEDYDSARAEDGRSPFQHAIGRTFSVTLDPSTGAIASVEGATEIQRAIDESVEDERERRIYQVDWFAHDSALQHDLELLLHILPPNGEVPGEAWEIKRNAPRAPFEESRPPLVLSLEVTATEVPQKGLVELAWSGSNEEKPTRKLAGSAAFGPKGLRSAKLHQEISGMTLNMVVDTSLVDTTR